MSRISRPPPTPFAYDYDHGKTSWYSSVERSDPKVEEIQKVLSSCKEAQPYFADLIKTLQQFTTFGDKWLWTGNMVRDNLNRIIQHKGGDIFGSGLSVVDESLKDMIEAVSGFLNALTENVQTIWASRELSHEKTQVANFEKDFKRKRDLSLKEVKKAEVVLSKASKSRMQKKYPEKEKEAKVKVNEAIKSHDALLCKSLHSLVLIERRRYAFFLKQMSSVLTEQGKGAKKVHEGVRAAQEKLQPALVADEEENWPVDLKSLIGSELSINRLHSVDNLLLPNLATNDDDDDDEEDDNGKDNNNNSSSSDSDSDSDSEVPITPTVSSAKEATAIKTESPKSPSSRGRSQISAEPASPKKHDKKKTGSAIKRPTENGDKDKVRNSSPRTPSNNHKSPRSPKQQNSGKIQSSNASPRPNISEDEERAIAELTRAMEGTQADGTSSMAVRESELAKLIASFGV